MSGGGVQVMNMSVSVERIRFESVPVASVDPAAASVASAGIKSTVVPAPKWPVMLLVFGGILTFAWTAALIWGVSRLATSIAWLLV
jgi:hypothetical protein